MVYSKRMTERQHLPTEFFSDEIYTIAPQRPSEPLAAADNRWLPQEPEGQLSVDVVETPEVFLITAPVAGVRPEELEIFLSHDLITIRGNRNAPIEPNDHHAHLFRECYWGRFSRSIILPGTIRSQAAEATLKNGLLSICLPKEGDSMYISVSEVSDE